MHPIHVAAEKVFEIWGIPITNTIVMSWLVIVILTLVSFFATRRMSIIPSGFQNIMEIIVEEILNFVNDLLGDEKKGRKVFAFATTLFLFIFVNNWMGVVPGVGAFGVYRNETVAPVSETADGQQPPLPSSQVSSENELNSETRDQKAMTNETSSQNFPTISEQTKPSDQNTTVPEKKESIINNKSELSAKTEEKKEEKHEGPELVSLLRPASSDLSFTIAMAVLTILYVQVMGISFCGFAYIKKFLNFTHPIKFFVGILEIISEFSRIISLAFRLFGNIFAGKVLLIVMTFLVPYIIPIPFYGIELFVGAIQAFVFFILALVFLRGAADAVHH